MGAMHIQDEFPLLYSIILEHPHCHALKCVSMEILSLVKLTVKTNHHREWVWKAQRDLGRRKELRRKGRPGWILEEGRL